MTVLDPKLSFVCFTTPFDTLPVVLPDDLKFQLRVEADSDVEADQIENGTVRIYLVKSNGPITNPSELSAAMLLDYHTLHTMEPGLIRLADKLLVIYWDRGVYGFESVIAIGECFRFCISITSGTASNATTYYTSNLMHRRPFTKGTSVLEYSCFENAYDFQYCNGYLPNRVRLPLFVRRPQWQDDESVYVRSDGSRKLLKSVTKKEYEGVVELLTEPWHERIKAALSHDRVSIDSKWYSGGISKSGNYETDWPEFMDFEAAPAKFKVLATPYNWRNSNCANCIPWTRATDGGGGGTVGCPSPVIDPDITVTSFGAQIGWTVPASPNVVEVEIILFEAQTPGTPVQGYPLRLPANANTHAFTGLTSNTAYQYYIRTRCQNNLTTPWVATINDPSFVTL